MSHQQFTGVEQFVVIQNMNTIEEVIMPVWCPTWAEWHSSRAQHDGGTSDVSTSQRSSGDVYCSSVEQSCHHLRSPANEKIAIERKQGQLLDTLNVLNMSKWNVYTHTVLSSSSLMPVEWGTTINLQLLTVYHNAVHSQPPVAPSDPM